MKQPSKGRQTPTRSFVLPYTKTEGQKAIDLYNSTGRTAQEWQELMIYDILAVNEAGLWVHTKFGWSVPRRNGKNEIAAIREMWGLKNGEHILHTAHRTTTTHAAWERLYNLLVKADIVIKSSYRAYGKEHIMLSNGAKIEFRTRTSKGGLGEGFDLLVIDEAQEYQDDQESALKYVVTDSKNPQTLFLGTPPTPVSSGTVFTKYRKDVLSGQTENSGWAEWSVEYETDPKNREKWYETNPSLGTVFTERSVADEIGSDITDFNVQRLGLWIQYSQKSAISQKEWEALTVSKPPKLKGKLFVGIKYNHDGTSVSMSVAAKTGGGKIFVEAVDCRNIRQGNAWIVDFLKALGSNAQKIVVDGAGGQNVLVSDMKDYKLKKPFLPTVKEIITANSVFQKSLYDGTVIHCNQPSLMQSVSNCEKRAIGSNGGFGYRSIKEGVDISLLDSVILAHWAASEFKESTLKQQVNY